MDVSLSTANSPNRDDGLNHAVVEQFYEQICQGRLRGQIARWARQRYKFEPSEVDRYWKAAVAECRADFDGDLADLRAVIAAGLMQTIQDASESGRFEAAMKGWETLIKATGVGFSDSDMIRHLTREGYLVTVEQQLEIPGIASS
jgi:hypothetical protein